MYQDKKNESGNIMFSLLRKIGDCGFNDEVSIADIQSSINYYMSL
jgi:3-dehydroquinate synthase